MPTLADRVIALERDRARLAAVERELAALRAEKAGFAAGAEDHDHGSAGVDRPTVPLKVAAHQMGVSEEAALKRAQRAWRLHRPGIGRYGGRWYFSRAYIDQASVRQAID